ncbi:MAG TPA: UDP-3-O-acyl-N-acetylglucosamine deacetylase [Candidatus Polarisedimenticolaceae bacterium]|nr:UDP-3-O-acyl-N-acetylglucosamine deacetylase [Candidatus Polarisedimenticolaceae bacterium]
MLHRQTLASPRRFTGKGVHTGRDVQLDLVPAEAGTGIVFVRTDAGGVEIPATLEHAGPSFYATVLERDGARVSTIEHLMAALYALQVDDLRIELNAPEVPILDGSSRPFVDGILAAGRIELPAIREYLTIVRPLSVAHEEKTISVHPHPEYRVTYAIDFDHPSLGYQELTASLWSARAFAEKLAPARTFAFEHEVEALRKAGLGLGGSLDNCVVLGKDGPLNPPLRFPDEFVRHKMLDLTGDLSLLGHPMRGHVVAYRAGHDLHGRLARKIRESPDAWYLAPWTESAGRETAAPEAAG